MLRLPLALDSAYPTRLQRQAWPRTWAICLERLVTQRTTRIRRTLVCPITRSLTSHSRLPMHVLLERALPGQTQSGDTMTLAMARTERTQT